MKLKRKTKEEKRNALFLSMMLDGKSIDEIKKEVFLFRLLAIFMFVVDSSITFISLNFDTSKWGYYLTDGLIPTLVYFWFCFFMSVFMAMYHNHKYKLLTEKEEIQLQNKRPHFK